MTAFKLVSTLVFALSTFSAAQASTGTEREKLEHLQLQQHIDFDIRTASNLNSDAYSAFLNQSKISDEDFDLGCADSSQVTTLTDDLIQNLQPTGSEKWIRDSARAEILRLLQEMQPISIHIAEICKSGRKPESRLQTNELTELILERNSVLSLLIEQANAEIFITE